MEGESRWVFCTEGGIFTTEPPGKPSWSLTYVKETANLELSFLEGELAPRLRTRVHLKLGIQLPQQWGALGEGWGNSLGICSQCFSLTCGRCQSGSLKCVLTADILCVLTISSDLWVSWLCLFHWQLEEWSRQQETRGKGRRGWWVCQSEAWSSFFLHSSCDDLIYYGKGLTDIES